MSQVLNDDILVFGYSDLGDSNGRGCLFEPLLDILKNKRPKICLLLGYHEYTLPGTKICVDYENLENICEELNIDFYILLGATNKFNLNESVKINRIKYIIWPTFYIHSTYYSAFENYRGKTISDNFNKLFISYNMRPHLHRCIMMDILCENNLLDYGVYSWNILTEEYLHKYYFKCWDEKLRIIDDYRTKKIDISENYFDRGCLVNLVTESNVQEEFISEKTCKPILAEQIFLCLGIKNQNNILKEYGFELYDEIFDYSFDSLDSLEDRCKGVANNLLKIKDDNYNQIHQTLKPKIKRNKEVFLSIIEKDVFLPKELIDMYQDYQDYFDMNPIHPNFNEIMKNYKRI